MPTSRRYQDACGIARGLDVLGERWALLVVRELLLAPQRFRDLRRALPGVSSNLLTDRLRELEAYGVLTRRPLTSGGPAVYELTGSGRELEPVVLALGAWGLRVPLPDAPTLSPTSVLLYLRGSRHPDPADPPRTYGIDLGDRTWTVTTRAGKLRVDGNEPASPDATVRTEPTTLNALLAGPAALDSRVADGSVLVHGDTAALRRLLAAT